MVVLRSKKITSSSTTPLETIKEGQLVQSSTPARNIELSLNNESSLRPVESNSKHQDPVETGIHGTSASGKARRRSLRFTPKSVQLNGCNGDSGATEENPEGNGVSEVLRSGDSSDELVLESPMGVGDRVMNLRQCFGKRNRSDFDSESAPTDIGTHGNSHERSSDAGKPIAERAQHEGQSHRRVAARFAHFNPEESEGYPSDGARMEVESTERVQEFEDWPGPFATAMKIIKDREKLLKLPKSSLIDKDQSLPIPWNPISNMHRLIKQSPPSLQDLCLAILVQNAEAISSLECVPDETKHKMTQLLCDSRKMTSGFFSLLLSGSPTEVRIKDCSWLSEHQFTNMFQNCDTSKITVLQLDQCGRCMPDYVIQTLSGGSSKWLPALSSMSLRGACRLSDIGLRVLVNAAPALKSINLSQCSLLTSDSIEILAESLGSSLKELYIDNCMDIDAMRMVDSLLKLKCLEVLSLAGIQTVTDEFIGKLFVGFGQNIKELVLADCMSLTDSSMRIISEACSLIEALDIANLDRVTDFSIGYLANGCHFIRRLRFCRNEFSDEALAAFLETRGQSLVELSLNNIKEIGHNTALSLAKHSKKLQFLDLSWCRKLSDKALGLIVDSCSNLKKLKVFGCSQITHVFLNGHSNEHVKIIGLKMNPLLEHIY